MTKWTKEQQEAIEKSGTNIIVSAGAGSGKTAVLSERVIYKLKQGVNINELLILTFTKAAAEEMKDRIRSKIKEQADLREQLDIIDTAYITTFDSFALSVLKKYHYLLNIKKDIKITDESIIKTKKYEIMDRVFDEFYDKESEPFLNLLRKYTLKSDKQIKKMILSIADKIEGLADKDSYIDYIENTFFKMDNIKKLFDKYKEYIINHQRYINLELNNLSYFIDGEAYNLISNSIINIINATTLEELNSYKGVRLPNLPRGSSDEAKEAKKTLKKSIDNLYDVLFDSKEDMVNNILVNKEDVLTIINLLKVYFNYLEEFKEKNEYYTFADVASLSMKILKERK